ncbi:MAG: hypothetical protein GKS01_05715 [Alphaproteobacteria bacterium]|nr:hypothetical protein [Alphaproteobacteria bacterium]
MSTLFIARTLIHLDHLRPLIEILARRGEDLVLLSSATEMRLEDQSWLQSLQKNHGLKFGLIFDAHVSGPFNAIAGKLLSANPQHAITKKLTAYAVNYIQRNETSIYSENWLAGLLKKFNTKRIVTVTIKNDRPLFQRLNDTARKLGIRSFAVPHAVDLSTPNLNDSRAAAFYTGDPRSALFNHFDHLLVENETRRSYLLQTDHSPDKIKVLGSPRYSRQWLDMRKTFGQTTTETIPDRGRFKVLYLDSGVKSPDNSVLVDMLNMIGTSKEMVLAVKLKPTFTKSKSTVPLRHYDPQIIIRHDRDTYELTNWADVVISPNTSPIVEAINLGKALIYLDFLEEFRPKFVDENPPCWIARNPEDVLELLRQVCQNPTIRPEPNFSTSTFVRDQLHGNESSGNVLNRYADVILSVESNIDCS